MHPREYPDRLKGAGFLCRDIPFYTGGPKVFVVGYPAVDHIQLGSFMSMYGLGFDEKQLVGKAADVLVESGARLCYLSHGKGRSHTENIHHLREVGHGSCYEHATITVIVTGVSRGLTHELVRHRVGMAVSQVSSRYVDPHRLGFVVPVLERTNDVAIDRFIGKCFRDLADYKNSLDDAMEALVYTDPDVPKTQRRKTARGCAREYLPIATHQFIQLTLNARTARHIIRMRGNPAAELQIQELADALAVACSTAWPVIMDDYDPNTNTFRDSGI